jgi:hypothetical protein
VNSEKLDHPDCPFCDGADEDVDHLLQPALGSKGSTSISSMPPPTPSQGAGRRVRKTGGNRFGSAGSRWNGSGPVHDRSGSHLQAVPNIFNPQRTGQFDRLTDRFFLSRGNRPPHGFVNPGGTPLNRSRTGLLSNLSAALGRTDALGTVAKNTSSCGCAAPIGRLMSNLF